MLDGVLAGIVRAVFELALFAAGCAAIAAVFIWLTRLQVTTYRRALSRLIRPLREEHYVNRGLLLGKSLLGHLGEHEAVELLSNGNVFRERDLPRWTLNLVPRLEASFENAEILADRDPAERARFKAAALSAARSAETRYTVMLFVLCSLIGIAVCLVAGYSLFATLQGEASVLFGAQRPYTGSLISQLLTGLACGVLAWAGILFRSEPRLGKDRPPPPPHSDPAPPPGQTPFKVGKPDEPIRAINFSAGGFDTVMQLGVIHALTVIQGKAPEAVVGLSVGAVNAAALAEVLQSGDDEEKRATPAGMDFHLLAAPQQREIQIMRLVARGKRLRTFIEAAHLAPERLFKALMPDAYQIESERPLAPLRQPRFAQEERADRARFVSARAGLARLYNRFLDIPLSIETCTKAIRRILGIRSAGDVVKPLHRLTIRALEFVHLWVLFGMKLHRAAALVPIFYRAYFPGTRSQVPATAALLIFRSRFMRTARKAWILLVSVAVLGLCWSVISVALLPIWMLCAIWIGIFYRIRLERAESAMVRNAIVDLQQGVVSWLAATLPAALLFYACARAMNAGVTATWLALFCGMLVIAAIVLVVVLLTRKNPERFSVRLIAPYGLAESWFQKHGVRTYLVDLFDRAYYRNPTMDEAVEAALQFKEEASPAGVSRKKTVADYWNDDKLPGERILVGLSVANTESKGLTIVPPETPLIRGLEAATALTPFLQPVELKTEINGVRRNVLYIDGSKVSHEPTHALLRLVRGHRNETHGPIHIYSVTPYPSTAAEMPEAQRSPADKPPDYLNLVDIARRAMSLQRFRDAKLERRLTTLVSRAIPAPHNKCNGVGSAIVLRAWIAPIELPEDTAINRRILGADKSDRRRLIEEVIADGCRAAMQVMLANQLEGKGTLKCNIAVREHFKASKLPAHLVDLRVCGAADSAGPGLAEICQRCSLNRTRKADTDQQMLQEGPWKSPAPDWPHERQQHAVKVTCAEPFVVDRPERDEAINKWTEYLAKQAGSHSWPRPLAQPATPSGKRATVSLLFSGGVFRGVFQLGVLNGLSEIGLKPDLVAGASVGSIMAAMAARTFTHARDDENARRIEIAQMAASFLTIDRLVLTDRFADFVRSLTVRAAGTRFSLRQADHVFRKYDFSTQTEFDREFRSVVAGIERLLYVSPYRLNELVCAIRTGDKETRLKLVRELIQNFLDRMQIGEEALGAEALEMLIERHVTSPGTNGENEVLTIDSLRERHGIQFLATTTNLNRGKLEILGEVPGTTDKPAPLLVQALLASSAFPGVFRPRWAWELSADAASTERFVDGGVMDNLPLDAIAQFLERAATQKVITRRPAAPHLIIAGSLEPYAAGYALSFTRERFKRSWPRLRERARQLSYNTKLDSYDDAERTIRALLDAPGAKSAQQKEMLEIQLASIKPNWLCGTFAMHPMLGFRRENQMMSIAHGCATTLRRFAFLRKDHADWFEHWGVTEGKQERLPKAETWIESFAAWDKLKNKKSGACWLNPGHICPFSRTALSKLSPPLQGAVVDEVSKIHELCVKPETHLRRL